MPLSYTKKKKKKVNNELWNIWYIEINDKTVPMSERKYLPLYASENDCNALVFTGWKKKYTVI